MPFKIVKRGGDRPFKIINKNTGKQVGSSKTRAKAEAFIRAVEAAERRDG